MVDALGIFGIDRKEVDGFLGLGRVVNTALESLAMSLRKGSTVE